MVFGARVAEDVRGQIPSKVRGSNAPAPEKFASNPPPQRLREIMTREVGLERDAGGLSRALAAIARLEQASNGELALLNMCATAKLITAAALRRQESRGAHFRTDYPAIAAPERTRMTLAEADVIASNSADTTQATTAIQ
jgi:L-aspartate oxidase